jgi:hypothetical protein
MSAAGSAARLSQELQDALVALLVVVETISEEQWVRVPAPGVWSIGKDAEHVADGNVLHLFVVRQSLHHRGLKRPPIERANLVTNRTRTEVISLLQQQTASSVALLASLSDADLALPTRPPRPRARTIADMIEQVMIGHYHVHRRSIEEKLGL